MGRVNDQNFSIYKVVKEYLFIFKGVGIRDANCERCWGRMSDTKHRKGAENYPEAYPYSNEDQTTQKGLWESGLKSADRD